MPAAKQPTTCCAPMMPPCTRPSRTKGLCHSHYERERRGKPVGVVLRQKGRPGIHLTDRKSTRLNSSHIQKSRMPSSA